MFTLDELEEILNEWFHAYVENMAYSIAKAGMNPNNTEAELRGMSYSFGMLHSIKESLLLELRRREEGTND